MQFSFADFRVDLAEETLQRGSRLIRLRPKAWAVLRYLLEHPGRLVRKEEIFRAVWPETAVTDDSLSLAIREIRKALGETGRSSEILRTEHKRGFRFIPVVTSGQPRPPQAARHPSTAAPRAPKEHVQKARLLVGRQGELASVHDAYRRACQGQSQVVFLSGEAGIGKTSLLDSFLGSLQQPARKAKRESRQQPPVIARACCVNQYGNTGTFAPIIDLLSELWRTQPALKPVLRRLVPWWVSQIPGAPQRGQSSGASNPSRAVSDLVHALASVAASQALILVLDDMEWSDAGSIDVVSRLASRPTPARLLLLVGYRPSDSIVRKSPLPSVCRELLYKRRAQEIRLGPLNRAAVDQYLQTRLRLKQIPAQVSRSLLHYSEGHPFFLSALVDALLEKSPAPPSEAALLNHVSQLAGRAPTTIQTMIEAKLTQLSGPELQLLEAASVLGLHFDLQALSAVLQLEEEQVSDLCTNLIHQGRFLERLDSGDQTDRQELRFQHSLYRTVLYDQLAHARRTALHRRAANHLEASGAKRGQQPNQSAILATHLERAGEHLRAVVVLQQSADRSSTRQAHGEAVAALQQSLAVIERSPQSIDSQTRHLALSVSLAAAMVRDRGFVHPQLPQVLQEIVGTSYSSDLQAAHLVAYSGLHLAHFFRGQIRASREACEHLQAIANKTSLPLYQVLADVSLGWNCLAAGDLGRAQALLRSGELLEANLPSATVDSGLPTPKPLAALGMALTMALLGETKAGRALADSACSSIEPDRHPIERASALVLSAIVHLTCGSFREAAKRAAQAVKIARSSPIRMWTLAAEVVQATAQAQMQPSTALLTRVTQDLARYQGEGYALLCPMVLVTAAEAALRLRQRKAATGFLEQALHLVESGGERFWEAEIYRVQALATANLSAREQLLRQAIEVAHEQQSLLLEQRSMTHLSNLLVATKRQGEAARLTVIEIEETQPSRTGKHRPRA